MADHVGAGLVSKIAASNMPNDNVSLHCMYTKNFEPMLVRFLSSLHDIADVRLINLSDVKSEISGLGGGPGLWLMKIDLLCSLADPANNPKPVVHLMTDIDLVFYGAIKPTILASLAAADIVLQAEFSTGFEANIGVIAFRPSKTVLSFWRAVRELIINDNIWDQKAVNLVIARLPETSFADVRVDLLPTTIWANSQSREVGFSLCQDVIIHHANGTSDLREKWAQINDMQVFFRRDTANHDYAFAQAKQKLTQLAWEFGILGREQHGTFSVDPSGMITGYHHPNETRIAAGSRGIYLFGADGKCTTFFNEFYFDPFRKKLLCVGSFLGRREEYHYLLGAMA